MQPKSVPLLISPLVNLTSDPAVDYFASALSRQVAQDLAASPILKIQTVDAAASGHEPPPADALTLTWTLAREPQGYRIALSLRDAHGASRGDQVFLVAPEDLHDAHRTISAYLTSQATKGPRLKAAP